MVVLRIGLDGGVGEAFLFNWTGTGLESCKSKICFGLVSESPCPPRTEVFGVL